MRILYPSASLRLLSSKNALRAQTLNCRDGVLCTDRGDWAGAVVTHTWRELNDNMSFPVFSKLDNDKVGGENSTQASLA